MKKYNELKSSKKNNADGLNNCNSNMDGRMYPVGNNFKNLAVFTNTNNNQESNHRTLTRSSRTRYTTTNQMNKDKKGMKL